ncbi:hypothetical protein FEM48_Zijuj04G0022100 [Ziziphus jujuba var. spinosa]|uniref:Uncharacterized protein n=1 Tax=Ziziphus jujuba var. spinosa TaxID=714518 RepID=A0A978VH89_ZIZJJ|nr:hypothetical protein FEM48_Zijuj04G0022100 [Ziziphus jujuba var. spinosa]
MNPFALGESSRNQSVLQLGETRTSGQVDGNPSALKLYFLKFEGEDPSGWIFKCEQYFEFQGVEPQHQVQLAFFHLEGYEFEQLSQYIDRLLESYLMGCFIAGLKDEVGTAGGARLRLASCGTYYDFTKDAVVHQLQGTKPDTLKELYGKGLHALDGTRSLL